MRFLLSVLLCAAPLAAQDTSMVSVPKAMLTPQQVEVLKQTNQVSQYGEWVGLGKEVGEAVNASLGALTSRAEEFAETKVGRVTMAIVVFKVLGKDLMGFTVGLLMLGVGVPIWIWSYRRMVLPHAVLQKETADKTKFYQVEEGSSDAATFHFFALAGLIGASLLVIFV